MNIKKMLASTLAVITMASGATALTSHAEDFTEVAEVEEMTLSALVAEQLEEKEIAGEISAEDVATTIRVAKQVEEMRNQDMISDEDVLEWEQALTGNNDMNGIVTYSGEECYTAYNSYRKTSGLTGTKHYFAIINGPTAVLMGTNFTVDYSMHNELTKGACWYAPRLDDFLPTSFIDDSNMCSISKPFRATRGGVGIYANIMRQELPFSNIFAIGGVSSEYGIHCYTSSNIKSPSDKIEGYNSKKTEYYNFVKCIYALGDVDRNGVVDTIDTLNITKNINHLLFEASMNSTTVASSYNEAAFNLAADVNLDETVNMKDVEEINKYILGQSSILR
ncbi:MAG: hypothetical protein HDT22_03475 [Ruminococcus sp.]|nr:hypothetical protein [Ruminococcus sp.]